MAWSSPSLCDESGDKDGHEQDADEAQDGEADGQERLLMPKDVKGIMAEWKSGTLHSGSKTGPVVKNPKQAVAIALNEKKRAGGVPGMMATRNHLKSMRMDTLPKGFKK